MAHGYRAVDDRHHRRVAVKSAAAGNRGALGPDAISRKSKSPQTSSIPTASASTRAKSTLPMPTSRGPRSSRTLFYVIRCLGADASAAAAREASFRVDEALRITASIAAALDYAHRTGGAPRPQAGKHPAARAAATRVDFGIALAVSRAGGERLTQIGISLARRSTCSPSRHR